MPDAPPPRALPGLPQLRGCVFIVTYGRSGSTLLQRIMNTIPGMCMRGENNNALEMLFRSHRRAASAHRGFGAQARDELHPWHGIGQIDPDAYAAALADLFVAQILRPPPDARWIGFKEIRYNKLGKDFAPYLNFIAKAFPNAHFLFNTRDVEAVARSSWWKTRGADEVRALITASDQRFARYAKRHPDRSRLTRYEDFSTDPEALRSFFELIGEPMDVDRIAAILRERLTH